MGFGEINQLPTGSCGGDNYEEVNEETPVTTASWCHLSLNLRDDATNERYYKDKYKWIGYKIQFNLSSNKRHRSYIIFNMHLIFTLDSYLSKSIFI